MITKAPFFFWGTYIYLCIFEWLSQLHIKRTKNNLLKIDALINWIACYLKNIVRTICFFWIPWIFIFKAIQILGKQMILQKYKLMLSRTIYEYLARFTKVIMILLAHEKLTV